MEETTLDLAAFDFDKPIADIAAIRKVLPHRFEMEMLTAIVAMDKSTHTVVGYKDVSPNEFWIRGHFPEIAVMPGVLMCEAAAQLCCYYTLTQGIVDPESLQGLGGLDEVRFYAPVKPGQRLILIGKGVRVNRRMNKFHVTGTVGDRKALEAVVVGVPLGKWEDLRRA